jgi:hypothetical protein
MEWRKWLLAIALPWWSVACSTQVPQPQAPAVIPHRALRVDEGPMGLSRIEPTSDVALLTRAARYVLFPDVNSSPTEVERAQPKRTVASRQVVTPDLARAQKPADDAGATVWQKLCLGACLTEAEWRFVDAHPIPPGWAARCTPLK